MRFVLDKNLPPGLARALNELSKEAPAVLTVAALRDFYPKATSDAVWLAGLTGSWFVVSIDKFKKDQRAEREAIARAGHVVYVLDPQWSSQQYWDKAARLVLWWPTILKHAGLTAGGVYRVPWKRGSQGRLATL